MAGIHKFEDLLAWQRARKLAGTVYRLSAVDPIARDIGYRDQFRNASISVMNNIAEGFGRRGDREFANFLKIAKGSVAEIQSMTYIGLDVGYLTEQQCQDIQGQVRETASLLHGLQAYLRTPSTIDHRPSTKRPPKEPK